MRRARGTHPTTFPTYGSSRAARSEAPLRVLPDDFAELSAPLLAGETIGALDNDLTRQHDGEPLGERISISGSGARRGRQRRSPARSSRSGRRTPRGATRTCPDQHPAPLDPNFSGAGRCLTDASGRYRFITIKPGAYPWRNHPNAWRPAHVHFSVFSAAFAQRLVTQMYFPGDPLFRRTRSQLDAGAGRERLVARWSLELTEPEWSLGYAWDIVVAGREATPLDDDAAGMTLPLTPSQTVGSVLPHRAVHHDRDARRP